MRPQRRAVPRRISAENHASLVHIRRENCKRRAQNKMQIVRQLGRKMCVTRAALAQMFAAVGARFAATTRSSTPKITRVWCTSGAKLASAARRRKGWSANWRKGVGKNHENIGAIDKVAVCIKIASFCSISAPCPSSMLILKKGSRRFARRFSNNFLISY